MGVSPLLASCPVFYRALSVDCTVTVEWFVVSELAMEYLDIGSWLPDLPDWPPVQVGWEQLLQIDTTYLAVAGCSLVFCILGIIAVKKWKIKPAQNTQTKSHEKHKEKGIKNIRNEETEKSKTNKWKRPDSQTSIQETEGKSKSAWFGGFTEKLSSLNKEISPETETKTEEKKKGWFSFPKEEGSKKVKSKPDVAETRDSFMRPINLNIDQDAQPREVSKKRTEIELQLVRKMCGEFREAVKLDNKEDREEKRKDMEQVRSARSYFKTADKFRSESLSGNPRIKFRTEDDFNDSYSRGNQKRLAQFTPGRINSRLTEMFGEPEPEDMRPQKPPKKKIITLDQILKKGSPKSDEGRITKEIELEELKESRKQWQPPVIQKNDSTSSVQDEIISLQFQTMPVKLRWKPTDSSNEVFKSLEIPNKLNIEKVYPNTSRDEEVIAKVEVEKELDELRISRPKRFHKIGQEERSASAHALQRVKLPDDSWVVEKSESRIAEERRKAIEELELVKQARLETLEALENMELERPSSRVEDQSRFEAMKELDEVRRARTVTMQDDEVRSEVVKIVENQLCQDIPNQISTDIDTETHDPDDDVTSQITTDKDTKVTHDHDDENHRLRSDQVNLK